MGDDCHMNMQLFAIKKCDYKNVRDLSEINKNNHNKQNPQQLQRFQNYLLDYWA